ncbi:MAG: glycoside hydrolase family 127 protein [Lentisphaeria bacterium]
MRKLVSVPNEKVQCIDGFWGERLRVNRESTLPIQYTRCKTAGVIDAFRLEWKSGDAKTPHVYWDSDAAKWIEAASYSLATHPDARLQRKVDDLVDLIASAQQEDGYLNCHFTIVAPEKRWANLRQEHELYCAGHLIEAAVAHYEVTGSRTLLDVVCRYADYIDSVFGRRRGQQRGYPGHAEIELALVKLYRVTGRSNYLDLARYFIDERGRRPHYFDKEARQRGEAPAHNIGEVYDYYQAHLPVREQKTAEGHAVRVCYLYAGMADIVAETGDKELLAACRAVWKNIVKKRMYIHGGIGSTRFRERFTIDYDLPNEEAYAETCAAIGLVFFAHRMLHIEPDRRYSDVIERALYNGIIAGASLDGKRFFYDNYLASCPGTHQFTGQRDPVRRDWFDTACCPPNLARLLASLGQYVYSQTVDSVFVHLFVNGETGISIGGRDVRLVQRTQYPWNENVRIDVSPASSATFTVAVRIPGWCEDARVTVNGEAVATTSGLSRGYLKLRRRWEKGDRIQLRLCMPVERVESHPSVRHNCGRIALQRGPVVYCLEQKDNGKDLHDLLLPRQTKLAVQKGSASLLKGIPVIVGKAFRRNAGEWKDALYQTTRSELRPCRIKAIPYFMWANRGEGEMLVWIREADESVAPRRGNISSSAP